MGADDYIAKPFRARELLSRIRSVLRRTNAASSLLRLGDVEIDAGTACVRKAGRDLALTALEYRLLLLFAQSRGSWSRASTCATPSGTAPANTSATTR